MGGLEESARASSGKVKASSLHPFYSGQRHRAIQILFYALALFSLAILLLHRSPAPAVLGRYSARYALLAALFTFGAACLALGHFTPRTSRLRSRAPLIADGFSHLPHAGALLIFGVYLCIEYFEVVSGPGALIALPPLVLGIVNLPSPTRTKFASFGCVLGSAAFFHGKQLFLIFGGMTALLSALCLMAAAVDGALSSRYVPGFRRIGRPSGERRWMWPLLIATGSLFSGLLISEALLLAIRATGVAPIAGIIPAELELQRIGGTRNYYWHGVLHRFNSQGFRGGDFPDVDSSPRDRYRIVALGDSLTYGYGVAEENTYPQIIERRLNEGNRVEVFNLGRSGAQSEDIVAIAREYVPRLRPDLVLYGHCLNDFLPSGVGEYSRYEIPIPRRIKNLFVRQTLVGSLANSGYSQLLIRLGLRDDFFSDILKDFKSYNTRFGNDVKSLNALAVESTGLPVLSLVLNQYPGRPEGRMVSRLAESRMKEAGIRVAPSEWYQTTYATSGVQLYVSRWEGHPNELAHTVFAQEFVKTILESSEIMEGLNRFRR